MTSPPSGYGATGRALSLGKLIRRRAWQRMQAIDPVRWRVRPAPAGTRVAAVCVYRARNVEVVRNLIAGLPVAAAVRLWNMDGEVPPDLRPMTLGTGPGDRFVLLNRLIADVAADDRTDGLLLLDDDVHFVVGDLSGLVGTALRFGLDLYQPAHSATSFVNWPYLRRRAFTWLRRTDFIEQGPAVGLSRRAQDVLLPLPEDMGMGWGVEVRWFVASLRHGLVQGIVDAVLMTHLSPTAQAYDRATGERGLASELDRAGLADIRSLQQDLIRVGLGQSSASLAGARGGPTVTTAATAGTQLEPSVSVVIPTHHRRELVLRVVNALLEDPAVLEIIVVIDGANDTTLSALNALAAHTPVLHPVWQEHAGAGAARQAGLELARGHVVLFLDDDVVPMPGLASAHRSAHGGAAEQLVVGALVPRTPTRRTVHSVVDDLYAQDYATCCREYERKPDTVLEHLWAGNMSLPRETALRVGIGNKEFDALFFEDRDFGFRLRQAGVSATFASHLSATHEHRGTLVTYLRDSQRQGAALHLLHRRYPGDVGPPDVRTISGRLPAPARRLVTLAYRRPSSAGSLITRALLVACYVCGWLGLSTVQRPLVILLRRTAQAAGAGAAAADVHGTAASPRG